MNRTEQREKQRWEILSAALDLFIKKGYAATRIQDIAKAVGMSVGLLYHYFKSKEKLYEELIKIGIAGPNDFINANNDEPLAFFRSTLKNIFHLFKTQPFVTKMFLLMSPAANNDGLPDSVKKLLADHDGIRPSVHIIKKGQRNGSIRKGDPVALSVAFWGAVSGIAELIAIYPDFPVPDSEWLIDILRSSKTQESSRKGAKTQ